MLRYAECSECGALSLVREGDGCLNGHPSSSLVRGVLIDGAGKKAFCSECGMHVFVFDDGLCPHGHPRSCLSDETVDPVLPIEAPIRMTFCSECGRQVPLCDDGRCVSGHPSSCQFYSADAAAAHAATQTAAQVEPMSRGSVVARNLLGGVGFVLGIVGFVGNALWAIRIAWVSLSANWLNMLNPFFDIEIVFRWVFSVPFWVLLTLAGTGYWLMSRTADTAPNNP